MGPRRPALWLSGLPRRPTLSDDGELTIGEGLYTSHRADAGRDPPVISARARTAQPRGAVGVPAAVRGRRSGGSPSGRCGRHDRRRPAPLSTQPNGYGATCWCRPLVLDRRGCCCTRRGKRRRRGSGDRRPPRGRSRSAERLGGPVRGPPTWPRGSRIAEDGRAERSPLARGEQPVASRPHRKERTSPLRRPYRSEPTSAVQWGRIARLRWYEGQLMLCRRFTGADGLPALHGRQPWPAPFSQVALVRGPRPRQGLRVQGRVPEPGRTCADQRERRSRLAPRTPGARHSRPQGTDRTAPSVPPSVLRSPRPGLPIPASASLRVRWLLKPCAPPGG